LYAVDGPGDWILAANGGEGHIALAEAGSVRLLPEEQYAGVCGAGVAVAFQCAPGPATLASLTPLDAAVGGWRLIVAEGEIIGSEHPTMEAPNAMVRLAGVPALEGYAAWCEAGASHHAAVLPGHRRADLAGVADVLGIECRVITPT
jgi:L-arabinose isomerase